GDRGVKPGNTLKHRIPEINRVKGRILVNSYLFFPANFYQGDGDDWQKGPGGSCYSIHCNGSYRPGSGI
ncbi:MAG: hypothetical protein OEU48_11845, partial [Gammaproteobacteria bacterium]|nr:hypothetical protein [Gammaproteobacteria bacterium]